MCHCLGRNGRRSGAGDDAADVAHHVVADGADPLRVAQQEWKGRSSAEVTATPTISKTMPTRTITSKMAKAATIPLRSISSSERKLMAPDTKRVITKIVITHLTVFLLMSHGNGAARQPPCY